MKKINKSRTKKELAVYQTEAAETGTGGKVVFKLSVVLCAVA
jgi:hypothetical protein